VYLSLYLALFALLACLTFIQKLPEQLAHRNVVLTSVSFQPAEQMVIELKFNLLVPFLQSHHPLQS